MIHRDDLNFELVESMEAYYAEVEPGKKLVFAGDLPEGSFPELEEDFRKNGELADASFRNGTCLSCLSKIEDYGILSDGWEPPEGWQLLHSVVDQRQCWICPDCENMQEEEPEEDCGGLQGDFE